MLGREGSYARERREARDTKMAAALGRSNVWRVGPLILLYKWRRGNERDG